MTAPRSPKQTSATEILRLALPALGALIAQPLFLLLDTAMIGHLGAAELAGASVALTIVTTLVSLMIFLAYAATPRVARLLGAGNTRAAVQAGIDGVWLGAIIGVVCAVLLAAISAPAVEFFLGAAVETTAGNTTASGISAAGSGTASAETATAITAAYDYLGTAVFAVPAILLAFAATGLERGLQNTTFPLVVSVCGFTANAALNALFIYGLGMGVAGSALGTVLAEWGMVAVFLWRIRTRARSTGASLRPTLKGLRESSASGGWLFLRTLSLRIAILITVWAAAKHGTTAAAGMSIVSALSNFSALVLDALAIAAQALVGKASGTGNIRATRQLVRQILVWSGWLGAGLGILLVAVHRFVPHAFSRDPQLIADLPLALLVLAASLPVCGLVFALDGILIGAGDHRYLAGTGIINLVVFAPPLVWLATAATALTTSSYLALLTLLFMHLYMLARLCTLGLRIRGTAWLPSADM